MRRDNPRLDHLFHANQRQFATVRAYSPEGRARIESPGSARPDGSRGAGPCLLSGAKLGMTFSARTYPVSLLWPSNALLLGVLLVMPSRWWLLLITTIVPAHLLAQLQWGMPLSVALVWLVSM